MADGGEHRVGLGRGLEADQAQQLGQEAANARVATIEPLAEALRRHGHDPLDGGHRLLQLCPGQFGEHLQADPGIGDGLVEQHPCRLGQHQCGGVELTQAAEALGLAEALDPARRLPQHEQQDVHDVVMGTGMKPVGERRQGGQTVQRRAAGDALGPDLERLGGQTVEAAGGDDVGANAMTAESLDFCQAFKG
jgi:hypothetical protein